MKNIKRSSLIRSGPEPKIKPTSNKFQPIRHGESIPNIYIASPNSSPQRPTKEVSITKSNSTCNSSSKPKLQPSGERRNYKSSNASSNNINSALPVSGGGGGSGSQSAQNSRQLSPQRSNQQPFIRQTSSSTNSARPNSALEPNVASSKSPSGGSVQRSQTSNSFDDANQSKQGSIKVKSKTRMRSNGSLRCEKNPYLNKSPRTITEKSCQSGQVRRKMINSSSRLRAASLCRFHVFDQLIRSN